MGFLSFLGLGKQAGDAIASPIDAVGNVLDKLFTSDDERAHATIVMEKLRQYPAELQVEVNKLEAQHRSTFVSGWRPAIGWVCAASLFVFYVPQFSLASYLWVKTCLATSQLVAYPITSIAGLMELVFGMLGLAGLRTVEKFGKVTR